MLFSILTKIKVFQIQRETLTIEYKQKQTRKSEGETLKKQSWQLCPALGQPSGTHSSSVKPIINTLLKSLCHVETSGATFHYHTHTHKLMLAVRRGAAQTRQFAV